MKLVKPFLLISALFASSSAFAQLPNLDDENVSLYWKNYVESRLPGTDLLNPEFEVKKGFIPPNFSYVGYQNGNAPIPTDFSDYKVFDVTQYGAIASDGKSDKEAFQDTAKAISDYAATNKGGAIFYIPEGDFIINSKEDMKKIDPSDPVQIKVNQVIKITGNNIVMQGAGADKTRLLMETHLLPVNPKQMWTTPHILQLGGMRMKNPPTTGISANVIADSSYQLEVNDASIFAVGDYVQLNGMVTDIEKIKELISPYELEKTKKGYRWGNLVKGWNQIAKLEIAEIKGNTITFKAPVPLTIDTNDSWEVAKLNPAVEVGVQDLTLQGAWDKGFVHHESALHDSGYSMLSLSNVFNGWIKNISVLDFNQGIGVSNSANVTIEDVYLGGNSGHIATSIVRSNNCLSINLNEDTDTWHAPGMSHYSTHNVHYNMTYSPLMSFDLHGAQVMNSLFDSVKGGWAPGHWGAAIKNQPNHLINLYFWNAVNTGEKSNNLQFMNGNSPYGRIAMPHLIGLQGNELNVATQLDYMGTVKKKNWAEYKGRLPGRKTLQANIESPGKQVQPASLYKAQRALREQAQ